MASYVNADFMPAYFAADKIARLDLFGTPCPETALVCDFIRSLSTSARTELALKINDPSCDVPTAVLSGVAHEATLELDA